MIEKMQTPAICIGRPMITWQEVVDKDVISLHLKKEDEVACVSWRRLTDVNLGLIL